MNSVGADGYAMAVSGTGQWLCSGNSDGAVAVLGLCCEKCSCSPSSCMVILDGCQIGHAVKWPFAVPGAIW